jgi:hypothetical protein
MRLVTMETNGTIFLPQLAKDYKFFLSCSPKFDTTEEDGKLKAHGQAGVSQWIAALFEGDSAFTMQLKFVVENEEMFEKILGWLEAYVPRPKREYIPLVFQPEYFKGREKFTQLVKKYSDPGLYKKLVDLGFPDIRFQIQMHKYIHVR